MRFKPIVLAMTALCGWGSVWAAPAAVSFTRKPTATRSADGSGTVKIEFAVSAPTDVAVYVEDAAGKVVCHLVAGALGKNPPPPLKPDSLAQSILWDGKDDGGKVALPAGSRAGGASGSPFKVRVTLGTQVELDRFLLANPDGSGPIAALAVGPGGTVYAFHRDSTSNGNMGGHKIKIYNRDGKHLRALTPFPADIAPEKVKALGVFQDADGAIVPRVHNLETLSFYPDAIGSRGRDMPDCSSSPAVDSKGRVYWLVKGPVLVAVDADGGVPYEKFLGPALLADVKNLRMASSYMFQQDAPSLAVSGDDQFVYFAGLSTAEFNKPATVKPLPCVYRVSTKTRGPGEVFVGAANEPGKEKGLLTAPRGLAVAKGMLYVADPGADRVVVFKEADRSYVGQIKVEDPEGVGVDPATGAVYVCAYTGKADPKGKKTADLVKFSGFGDGKELARLTLPRTAQSPNPGVHRIAVDASAKGGPVRIWLPEIPWGGSLLKCIEDDGGKLVDKGDPRGKGVWAEGPRDLTVDRQRDELYVKGNWQKYYRLDEKTGQVKDLLDLGRMHIQLGSGDRGTQLVAGPDGNLYTNSWSVGLWRFDHQGKLLNWDGQSTPMIPIGGMMCFQERHLALRPFAPPDEFYLIPPSNYLDTKKNEQRFSALNVFGQDGRARRTVIWQCSRGAIPRLDGKGNVYLADLPKPPDRSYPEFFDGKLPPPPKECGGGDLFWNSYMYGSIIKFPPSGGVIWYQKGLTASVVGEPPAELLDRPRVPVKVQMGYQPHSTAEVQGALWQRFGYSPYSNGTTGMTSHCMCEGSGFDVDPFGRVFFPNLGQFRVEVIDTNNNPITTFGQYGNEDSGGKDAKVAKPEIPLAWPAYVACSDDHVYVADTVNRRVVRVKLAHAADESCLVN